MKIVSSEANFWSFRFKIDEHMTTRVSKLEVRLHQTQDKCDMYRVFLLREIGASCSTEATMTPNAVCQYISYGDNTDTSNGGHDEGPHCTYECHCSVEKCSDLFITMSSKSTQTSELCSITWYMMTEK